MSLIERTCTELIGLRPLGKRPRRKSRGVLAAIRDRDPKVQAFLHVDRPW